MILKKKQETVKKIHYWLQSWPILNWLRLRRHKVTSAVMTVTEYKVSNIFWKEPLTLIMTFNKANLVFYSLLKLHAFTWMQALLARDTKKSSKFIRRCRCYGYFQKLKTLTYPQYIHSAISDKWCYKWPCPCHITTKNYAAIT